MTEQPAVHTLAERPDLEGAAWDMPTSWPAFMFEDPVADRLMGRLFVDVPEFQLVAVDAAGDVVAKGFCIPFVWDGDDASLPARGWDAVLEQGTRDLERGLATTAVSALEISIRPDWQGRGMSALMLGAMRENCARHGFSDLVAPVRPSAKSRYPTEAMGCYVRRRRPDGLPDDPWLRVHVRAGGRIVGVCPLSMTIPGRLDDWRRWTGLAFDVDGPVEVPGALSPVHVATAHDHAVYVEPNVWVHHRLAR